MKDDKTSEILKRDTLAETEKIVGKEHYSEFSKEEELFALCRGLNFNKAKREHLQSIGDTHFGTTWAELKTMLIDFGFIEGYSYPIEDPEEEQKNEAILWYHPDKGLILFATSYYGTSVNGGTCYGEIKAHAGDKNRDIIWEWLSTGGKIKDTDVWETSWDIREGMFHRIKMLESAGTFQKKWKNKDRFLWFVDWSESKPDDYDYKTISSKKLKKCPKAMRDIIR